MTKKSKETQTAKYYKEAVEGLNATILEDKDLWYSYLIHLPQHLQITYTIVVFHQQVFNGGFHQYFFNSYGQFAYLTFEHLNFIKAFKTADILSRALAQVNMEGLSIDAFRKKIFFRELERIVDFDDKLYNSLEQLDNEYYEIDENLEYLLENYYQTSNFQN